jgi:hypothetical protein
VEDLHKFEGSQGEPNGGGQRNNVREGVGLASARDGFRGGKESCLLVFFIFFPRAKEWDRC